MADTVETLEIQISHRASGAAAAIKSTANATKSLANAVQPATKSLKGMSNAVAKTKSPLDNFVSSLKRIAFYRFIRSIIKGITEAFTEGLQKAYLFSSGIAGEGNRFAKALDLMKASGNQLKGQLGSAFAALLTAIEPILSKIIDLCVRVADAISQLLSAFTGTTYLKANKTASKFADTMKSGAGAAKEWKNQLMGFDEINRLNEPSGGGGGGSNPLDGYSFEDTPIDQLWLDLVQNPLKAIKDAFMKVSDWFDGKDWQDLGRKAWDKVKGWFSDNGSATEAVNAFFQAIGSAFGAVAGMAWGFLEEPVKEMFRQFKQNIKDYDGDSKVSVMDIIVAAVKTWIDYKKEIFEWVMTNIVTPFFDGLVNAFDSSENNERTKEVGQNIIRGITAGMNLFMDGEGKFTFSKLFDLIILIAKEVFGIHSPSTVFEDIGRNIVQGLLNGFTGAWGGLEKTVSGLFSNIISWCQSAHGWLQDVLDGIGLVNNSSVSSQPIRHRTTGIQEYANGGFPDEGQLFIAREAGAEMVGNIGGRTAVANNQEITEGIRQAVYDAMMASNFNNSNGGVWKIYLDSREIKAGIQRVDRAWGA